MHGPKASLLKQVCPRKHTHTNTNADEQVIHKHSEGTNGVTKAYCAHYIYVILSYTCAQFSLNDAQKSISQHIVTLLPCDISQPIQTIMQV